jgi:cyclopropane fatty-acyl-phospholipid synthase-like methyltransferase
MIQKIVKCHWIESALSRLVLWFHDAQFRADWGDPDSPPHFFNHRQDFVPFIFSETSPSPYTYTRAFFSALAVRSGETVLDIGCGDGFFTKRFLASRASHVDGIDIDGDAIKTALRLNSGDNISYRVLDATADPFPLPLYDVVVWDGAIGHFSRETTDQMLARIRDHLSEDGVFCGSESIGEEGADHRQFFASAENLGRILRTSFTEVETYTEEYVIPSGVRRVEVYWRCALKSAALARLRWARVL